MEGSLAKRVANTLGRVVGYHGCDRTVAEKLLAGHEKINHSSNEYDWLGKGAYFWVDSAARAADWAKTLHEDKKIDEPYVVGAFIHTGLCLNLLDVGVMGEIQTAFDGLCGVLARAREKLPVNTGHRNGVSYHRALDAAVFNYLHDVRMEAKLPPYDTVLNAFEEGEFAFNGASFRKLTHVQIAVRNDDCIIGYFRVREHG